MAPLHRPQISCGTAPSSLLFFRLLHGAIHRMVHCSIECSNELSIEHSIECSIQCPIECSTGQVAIPSARSFLPAERGSCLRPAMPSTSPRPRADLVLRRHVGAPRTANADEGPLPLSTTVAAPPRRDRSDAAPRTGRRRRCSPSAWSERKTKKQHEKKNALGATYCEPSSLPDCSTRPPCIDLFLTTCRRTPEGWIGSEGDV